MPANSASPSIIRIQATAIRASTSGPCLRLGTELLGYTFLMGQVVKGEA
jgi:hypothetical protein